QSSLERRLGLGSDDRRLYRAFVAFLLAGDWEAFFEAYPALARLCGQSLEQWIDFSIELLSRLEEDRGALERRFMAEDQLGPAVEIRPLGADRHNFGRFVVEIRFESGKRLVYKPRTVGIENRFHELVGWLGDRGVMPSIRTPDILVRDGYGWVEFVEPQSCADEDAVKRYYNRAGALLAVVYALEGIDCHMENLIAHGEHPVLIDVETLPYPRPHTSIRKTDAGDPLSVLHTHLLPMPTVESKPDQSGISGRPGISEAYRWQDVNTDAMALRAHEAPTRLLENLPTKRGEPLSASRHVAEVSSGFEGAYRGIVRHRTALQRSEAWRGLGEERVRFLPRATRLYHDLLLNALHPKRLVSGAERSIEFEVLSRGFVEDPDLWRFWPMARAEMTALHRMDIPYVTAATDGHDLLFDDGTRLPDFFAESGMERAEKSLSRMGSSDLEEQLKQIRDSLAPL
ncbi:MAG: type 2 lanthipeptide synthetase LanM family protein, partial [Gemmatimonadota bacterium]|nr:type 2 lanthipeptide synthetase LanM family protein [Gemmatimonadota bacterium]